MAARKRKPKHDLSSQDDPRAPLDPAAFLAAAKPVLVTLTKDLLARADASPNVTAALQQRHAHEKEQQRTGDEYPEWRHAFIDQVAAAWLLSCVFARTLEDRGLVSRARIAGPGALDSERMFRQLAPSLSERDYLLAVFRELARLPAARDLFDARHNPVWLLGPSAEAARALLALFRAPQPEAPAFRFGNPDTRFLGDLYQDLNEDVKKRYALLQTPRFVEEFILDRTLDRAIERFGLADTTLIDPTCGSGHFLLGAFERLFRRRLEAEPGLGEREAARLALDAVYGADINPYSVAIARFRLTLAFLEKADFDRLDQAPALPLHVAVADSLLHNPQLAQAEFKNLEGQRVEAWSGQEFALEDEAAARDVMHRQYAAVVGNPPYITVKDAVLRDRYRAYYQSAYRSYSLGVPFTERFFQLGKKGAAVGMITANSFMKREFGKRLIEEYLPTVNLELIINTSGGYIPGHGTPTVLLFGTSDPPQGTQVHALLASRGEPSTPHDPEQGLVWRSIADHWNEVGFENEYVTVAEVERASLGKHPWSLGGGGAAELKELLEERSQMRLSDVAADVGKAVVTRENAVYLLPSGTAKRWHIDTARWRAALLGEDVRDWAISPSSEAVWPYTPTLEPGEFPDVVRALWPWKKILSGRVAFGKSQIERGLPWSAYSMMFPRRAAAERLIGFPLVATHNHFVLLRPGLSVLDSVPVIKLSETATENDHLALLAYLNSSTACFWMKQVFFPKYGAVKADHPDPARNFYEFAGTGLQQLPLPDYGEFRDALVECARCLEDAARERAAILDELVNEAALDGADADVAITAKWRIADKMRRRLVALQEEVDWLTYVAFRLAPVETVETSVEYLREIELTRGQRAFEADSPHQRSSLVRRSGELLPAEVAEVETAPPTILTPRQRELQRLRRRALAASPELALIEMNVFKRLWRDTEQNETERSFRDRVSLAAKESLALEWCEQALGPVGIRPVKEVVASAVSGAGSSRDSLVTNLDVRTSIERNSVPFLSALRFAPSGSEKHGQWQRTWELQRAEDRGESVGEIPVPPKYAQGDFRSQSYWSLRGKLDVPKERFISYPGCESDEDGEPVYGWAGWDHAQRATALGALYMKRKQEGWDKERLMPMLAGLLELLPWLHQWHAEPDDLGRSPSEDFQDFLDGECRVHSVTHSDLRGWRPAEKKGRAKKRAAKASEVET